MKTLPDSLQPNLTDRVKILVIEDDEMIREAFRRYFGAPTREIVEATTVKEALAILETVKPHLIVLDLKLTLDETPLDTVMQVPDLLSASPHSALVVFSGCASEVVAAQAKLLGVSEVIEKPSFHKIVPVINAIAQRLTEPVIQEQISALEASVGEKLRPT